MISKFEDGTEEAAQSILNYLKNHPDSEADLSCIARWWIARQRLEESLKVVQAAVDLLIQNGRLTDRRRADGRVVYSLKSMDPEGR